MFKGQFKPWVCLVPMIWTIVLFAWCADGYAAGIFSSSDLEKPKPEFTRRGEWITAKLIPRAKSTSVQIGFAVTGGGRLEAVKGVDFAVVERPDVDAKNFKSAVFEISIQDMTRGGTATLVVRSDFFTLSTAFYVFNPKRANPWIRNVRIENKDLPGHVRELIVPVQDGGELDADGSADGRVTLIGGPRDSFWGYALGTLFIRFFGIFIVLTLLMLGMMVSGVVFKALDRSKASKSVVPDDSTGVDASTPTVMKSAAGTSGHQEPAAEEIVAVIGAALYLRDRAAVAGESRMPGTEPGIAWTLEGRKRIMNERLMVFNRSGRSKD
jgi:hypothetical protein